MKNVETKNDCDNLSINNVLNIMENVFQNHQNCAQSLSQFQSLYYIPPVTTHIGTVLASKRVR